MNMTTDSGDAAQRSSIATRHSVIPGKVRMEFVQVSNIRPRAASAEGMYQADRTAADSTMLMVMPSDTWQPS